MAAFTSIGPIGVRQMNRNLYVGHNDLTTIQAAVTAAAQMGGVSTVYIPPEYAGTDSPTAVTGGNSSIYLMDERNGQRQSYLWYNSAYVKEPIIAAGVATPQLNHYIYVGIEGQWPTIQGAVNNAVAGGIGDFVIITTSYGGSETIGSITGGAANVFIVDERTAQRQVYEWNGTNYIPSDFEPLGAIRADLITANDLSVTDASFDTATVADSPVRTFANTPDGPGQGMVWPTPGIPVSLGSTWQTPSIDPDDLATWPAAGIPTSTGAAWSASIDPATVPRLNVANTFTSAMTLSTGPLSINGAIIHVDNLLHIDAPVGSQGLVISTLNTRPDFLINPAGTVITGGDLIVNGVANMSNGANLGGPLTATSAIIGGTFEVVGTATFDGLANINGGANLGGPLTAPSASIGGNVSITGATTFTGLITANGGINTNGNASALTGYIATTFHVAGRITADQGVAASDAFIAGPLTVTADLNVSGAKNFRITHPQDNTKQLVHSCVEGPECAVFYRGEAETVDGKAEITLPAYFEALVMEGRRTIHLTELYEDEDEPVFGNFLAAGRINNGKFMVRSSTPTVKFYWEVKAVRGDIDPLEVERPIAESVESAKA